MSKRDEAADAVVVVHHVIARPQVAERDQRPTAADATARRAAPEQLGGRDHRQSQPRDHDAVSQRRMAEGDAASGGPSSPGAGISTSIRVSAIRMRDASPTCGKQTSTR